MYCSNSTVLRPLKVSGQYELIFGSSITQLYLHSKYKQLHFAFFCSSSKSNSNYCGSQTEDLTWLLNQYYEKESVLRWHSDSHGGIAWVLGFESGPWPFFSQWKQKTKKRKLVHLLSEWSFFDGLISYYSIWWIYVAKIRIWPYLIQTFRQTHSDEQLFRWDLDEMKCTRQKTV